jgi:hypothetical protein
MEQMADFTGGDDFRGVQDAQNRVFREVKPIHSRVKTVVEQPGADVLIAQGAFFHLRAVLAKLSQININEICVGHGGPFRMEVQGVFCRAERIGQSESLAGWEIFCPLSVMKITV